MTHILGLQHSMTGILGQGADLLMGVLNPAKNWVNAGLTSAAAVRPPLVQAPMVSPLTPNVLAAAGSPFIPDIVEFGMAGAPTGTTATEVIIDNATGACISVKKKKKRRRRKRLATASDIKDLGALKAVLGGGKAFDTWIATRGRG